MSLVKGKHKKKTCPNIKGHSLKKTKQQQQQNKTTKGVSPRKKKRKKTTSWDTPKNKPLTNTGSFVFLYFKVYTTKFIV
jgi:hypothetical protein